MKKINGFYWGLLVGGVAAGASVMMLATRSGKSLRYILTKRMDSLISMGKKKAADTWSEAREKTESSLETANEFLNTGAEKNPGTAEKISGNRTDDGNKTNVNENTDKAQKHQNKSEKLKPSKEPPIDGPSYNTGAFAKDAENTY